ncbi:MAGUK p55 subfamily member 6-like [Gigantopelta aegis]|uniref:MAGUK p55 subfamily member 6-like n=1 Tax=Gigantopelta aegis TaxID=1735272 RepID=UPI001B88C581|nr:MAGUK p55 subfamily member 6-like [Gigantopelta aegis]
MERDIQANKFLEYGESKGHLYGLSVKAVNRVIENNKVPVLDLHPQALKVIGSSGLMPYIIYIASPRLDRLQMTRRITSEKLKKKLHTSVSAKGLNKEVCPFTESELLQLYHASQEIQAEYGHYFDWMIVNDDLQVASDLLIEVARRIEEEPQWIPASWVEEV